MKKLDVPQSGSQADTVASRNRFGQYNRTRAMPTQPRTTAQVTVRGYMSDASQAWRDLTDEERASWNAFAAERALLDSLGQTIFLTGHQTFVSLWIALSNGGLATPPDVPSETPPPPPGTSLSELSDNPTIEISVDDTLSADLVLLVFASPQASAGRTFNGDYRFIASFTSKTLGVVQLASAYVAKFGALIGGRKIFFRTQLITIAGGLGQPTDFTGVVEVSP